MAHFNLGSGQARHSTAKGMPKPVTTVLLGGMAIVLPPLHPILLAMNGVEKHRRCRRLAEG
jgi:hypothetical protein